MRFFCISIPISQGFVIFSPKKSRRQNPEESQIPNIGIFFSRFSKSQKIPYTPFNDCYNKICIAGNSPKSVEKLVEEIYVGLEPHFVVAAGINVSLTLDKLQNDAKVSETAEGWLKK